MSANRLITITARNLLFAALLLSLAACSGNTYKVHTVDFTKPAPPAKDQVQVYVFREDTAFASARKFAIIANDTVMSVLLRGTFSTFTLPDDEYEIVAHMSPSPVMHHRINQRGGQTVYLYCNVGYASGMYMEEITAERAAELMATYKYTEIERKGVKTPVNYKDHYDKLYPK
ncbi:MAG: hypothetical protein AB1916_16275 [Thermodesulfobacteriota bacterium]